MRIAEVAVVGGVVAFAASVGIAAAHLATPRAGDQGPAVVDRKAPSQPDLGDSLVAGLLASPGCLGADACRWNSGKSSIIGWFEDKDAVIAWYDSTMHERLMEPMGGASDEPLAHVPDDQGPIMILATITPSARPEIEGFPAPISQISIEMFAPLPGGAYINGRLAPEGFEVEHMRDLAAGAP